MPSKIHDLPFDVLFGVFMCLSIQDISRIAQTCKQLHDWADEPSIWANHYAERPTMFPPTPCSPISAKEIRRRVVHETIVDVEWRKTEAEPRTITKLYPRNYTAVIEAMDIFPGGNFVLVSLGDGSIDVRNVSDDTLSDTAKGPLGPYIDCAKSITPPKHVFSTILSSSYSEGYICVQVKHAPHESDHESHFRFYSFHLQGSSAQLTLVTDFTIPTHTRVFGWSIFDNTVGCIYENPVGELYFCTANLALFVSTLTVKFGQVGFDLFKITDESPIQHSYEFIMLSTQRLMAVSVYSVLIYDIPNCPTKYALTRPISPIWRWPADTTDTIHNFQCGALSHGSSSEKAEVWILDGRSALHQLNLSNSGHPVEKHTTCPLEFYGSPAIGSSRAMWMHRRTPTIADITTLSLSNPPTTGTFTINIEEGEEAQFKTRYAFDEVSGRVILGVEDGSGSSHIYVASIARLP